MHPTTSTLISDATLALRLLDEKLVHANFIPEQELTNDLIGGAVLLGSIFSGTTTDHFSEDECDYVVAMDERIHEHLNQLVAGDLEGNLPEPESDGWDDYQNNTPLDWDDDQI